MQSQSRRGHLAIYVSASGHHPVPPLLSQLINQIDRWIASLRGRRSEDGADGNKLCAAVSAAALCPANQVPRRLCCPAIHPPGQTTLRPSPPRPACPMLTADSSASRTSQTETLVQRQGSSEYLAPLYLHPFFIAIDANTLQLQSASPRSNHPSWT